MKKNELKKEEFFILSIIAEKDTYGYELKKKLEETKFCEVTGTNIKSLYAILNKLSKLGLIDYYEERVQNAPPRKIYRITQEGNNYLSKKIMNLFDNLHKLPTHPFMFILRFWDLLPEEKKWIKFENHIKYLKKAKEELEQEIKNIDLNKKDIKNEILRINYSMINTILKEFERIIKEYKHNEEEFYD